MAGKSHVYHTSSEKPAETSEQGGGAGNLPPPGEAARLQKKTDWTGPAPHGDSEQPPSESKRRKDYHAMKIYNVYAGPEHGRKSLYAGGISWRRIAEQAAREAAREGLEPIVVEEVLPC